VLSFDHADFHGEIIAELERLREGDTVRVIDSLAVRRRSPRRRVHQLTRPGRDRLGDRRGA
jgi:hypothetical protein